MTKMRTYVVFFVNVWNGSARASDSRVYINKRG